MITAVDTNILIYVLAGSAEAEAADAALAEALYAGELIISEPVYAEVAGQFDSAREVQAFFNRTGLRLVATTDIGLFAAGHAWRAYSARRRHATSVLRAAVYRAFDAGSATRHYSRDSISSPISSSALTRWSMLISC